MILLQSVHWVFLTAMFFLLSSCQEISKEEASRENPNIVYILADDLGYGDPGCYNANSRIPTPNIDQLATQGMKFLDAHAPSAVCTPTRYGILTGRYCWRSRLPVGVLRGYGRSLIESDRLTVAGLLKREGYFTGIVGKWHLGLDWILKEEFKDSLVSPLSGMNEVGMVKDMDPAWIDFSKNPSGGPREHGFDYSYILPASLDMDPYCYLENDQLVGQLTDSTPGNDLHTGYTGAFWRPGKMTKGFQFDQVTPTFIQKSTEFIRNAKGKADPFFLYLPLPSPHTPWVPTDEFTGKSEAGSYGDFTSMVDAMVGLVLATLDSLELSENTLVIFASDNGPFWTPELIDRYQHRAAGSWRGMKADAYEGGHRIPLIVRWPGKIQAGSVSEATVCLTSLIATCADILQLTMDENTGEDSKSIWPILSGKSREVPDQEAIIQHSSKDYFVVRKGDWKLITGVGSGGFTEPSVVETQPGEAGGQLYNLLEDSMETDNLFLTHPDKVTELTGLLERYKLQGHSRF